MSPYDPELEEEIATDTQDETDEPSMYRVLLLNDDYTTMEFVVEVLMYVFHKTMEEATQIMLKVHRDGVGLCGTYAYEIAETKVSTVNSLAQDRGFPLKCIMEKE
jgi:ATP-dependent Clp protease adaptor protein ClpS